jgi:hypothetical protein
MPAAFAGLCRLPFEPFGAGKRDNGRTRSDALAGFYVSNGSPCQLAVFSGTLPLWSEK